MANSLVLEVTAQDAGVEAKMALVRDRLNDNTKAMRAAAAAANDAKGPNEGLRQKVEELAAAVVKARAELAALTAQQKGQAAGAKESATATNDMISKMSAFARE